jgi:hypothetical protein
MYFVRHARVSKARRIQFLTAEERERGFVPASVLCRLLHVDDGLPNFAELGSSIKGHCWLRLISPLLLRMSLVHR